MSEPQIRVTRVVEDTPKAHHRVGGQELHTVEQQFLEYFGLNEQPFGVTPDPRFLYLGPKHSQALAALNYGTELNRGFLTLIAPPGMGKTSLLFQYLDGLRNRARTAFIFQTPGNPRELMYYLLDDLGLDGTGKELPEMHAMLNRVLMEEMRAGRRFVLIIDEAQNLDEKVLESIRLLSNFETPWTKLTQIVLTGQPQLAKRLAKPSMAQLRQRVSLSIRIEPLTSKEVNAYIDHRLWVAGYTGSSLFSVSARTLLVEFSEGIPRNINNMCFCAMSLGWATKQKTVDREMMSDILADLNLGPQDAKTTLAPKSNDTVSIPVSQDPRSAVLTVKESAPRGSLPKIAVVCAVLFALGWAGVQFNIGKRIVFSRHTFAGGNNNSFLPTLSPTSPAQATPADSNNTLLSQLLELTAKEKNPAVPQQSGAVSPILSRASK